MEIGIQRFAPELGDALGFGQGKAPVHACRALLDTGAYRTAMTQSFVLAAGLRPLGKVDVVTVGHEARHRTYLVNMAIYARADDGHPPDIPFAIEDPVAIMNMQDNVHFDVILGMDVLEKFDFVLRRNGTFFLQLTPPLAPL